MRRTLVAFVVVLLVSGLAAAQTTPDGESESSGTSFGPTTSLNLEVYRTEPSPLQAGEYADIWVRVVNEGDTAASDPSFRVKDNYPFTPTDRDTWEPIGELGPGEEYQFRAQVKVDENAVFGENELKIERTSSGDVFIEEKIPLEVRVDDRSLIVSELDLDRKIPPGSSSEMTVEMENLANSVFRNIDISLETSGLPVATRETSRKRISSIDESGTEEVSFTLDVDDDADIELYDLPITIDYQDQAGNELSMTETTGVNVGGFPNLDVQMESSDIRTPGRGEAVLSVINKGEGQARFTEIELLESEQYEILSEDRAYIGTMIDDDFQTAEFDLYVEEDELLELPVRVTYTDGDGEQQEEFTVERRMYSSSELRQYGLETGGASTLIIILILAAGVTAGVYYWRRRREDV